MDNYLIVGKVLKTVQAVWSKHYYFVTIEYQPTGTGTKYSLEYLAPFTIAPPVVGESVHVRVGPAS